MASVDNEQDNILNHSLTKLCEKKATGNPRGLLFDNVPIDITSILDGLVECVVTVGNDFETYF